MKIAILLLACLCAAVALPQEKKIVAAIPPHVNWVDLHVPKYPPLAAQAHIQGTVQLSLTFHNCALDREHIVVLSGHPMLTSAAMESVRDSAIGCGDFRDGATVLTFEFLFDDQAMCDVPEQRIELNGNTVRVFRETMCVETSTGSKSKK